MAYFVKDHDTKLAQARAIMLSNDVTDLVTEGSEDIWDLLIMQQAQVRILARPSLFSLLQNT